MSRIVKLGRRGFLKLSAGAGAGLWLGTTLPGDAEAAAPASFQPSAFLSIERGGRITVWVAKAEMGQGVRTSLPALIAEELDADWKRIDVQAAVAHPKYGEMMTGGSTSVRTNWDPMRKVGAAARQMLVAAAARRWRVDPASCRTQEGEVLGPGGKRLAYGDLVTAAARLPVPEAPRLKDPKDYRLVGKPLHRLDTPEKITGRAVFGLDVSVPNMLYAAVARCPVFGGKARSFDTAKARAVQGVRGVHAVASGIAVVADSTWAALKARDALVVQWDEGPAAKVDSASLRGQFQRAALGAPEGVARKEGEGAAALARARRRIEATYEVPFLAHATMEPMNCTAHVREGRAELWLPSQAPQWAQAAVAKELGMSQEKVLVHALLLGGGFGRRAMPDVAVEAALVSRAVGAPVKVVWTREDDTQHDFYRPASLHRLVAGLDATGAPVAWTHRVVAPSIAKQIFGRPSLQPGGERPDMVEGAWDLPYAIPAIEVDYAMPEVPVPVGWWRSVYASQTAFANECFFDEIAIEAGKDPVALRAALLKNAPQLRAALLLAADKSGWGKPPPPGRARGVACHSSFFSHAAEVAEVSVEAGKVRVHRVVAAVHCGRVVNPDILAAQVESAIAYGLSAALQGEITLERGRVQQSNFDDYQPLRIDEMPAVEVHVVPSGDPPTGIGEPGLPPVAPAVMNAMFAATRHRVRRLPARELKV
jgi:isoquinoline 1-oxidoreductase subunit beta